MALNTSELYRYTPRNFVRRVPAQHDKVSPGDANDS